MADQFNIAGGLADRVDDVIHANRGPLQAAAAAAAALGSVALGALTRSANESTPPTIPATCEAAKTVVAAGASVASGGAVALDVLHANREPLQAVAATVATVSSVALGALTRSAPTIPATCKVAKTVVAAGASVASGGAVALASGAAVIASAGVKLYSDHQTRKVTTNGVKEVSDKIQDQNEKLDENAKGLAYMQTVINAQHEDQQWANNKLLENERDGLKSQAMIEAANTQRDAQFQDQNQKFNAIEEKTDALREKTEVVHTAVGEAKTDIIAAVQEKREKTKYEKAKETDFGKALVNFNDNPCRRTWYELGQLFQKHGSHTMVARFHAIVKGVREKKKIPVGTELTAADFVDIHTLFSKYVKDKVCKNEFEFCAKVEEYTPNSYKNSSDLASRWKQITEILAPDCREAAMKEHASESLKKEDALKRKIVGLEQQVANNNKKYKADLSEKDKAHRAELSKRDDIISKLRAELVRVKQANPDLMQKNMLCNTDARQRRRILPSDEETLAHMAALDEYELDLISHEEFSLRSRLYSHW